MEMAPTSGSEEVCYEKWLEMLRNGELDELAAQLPKQEDAVPDGSPSKLSREASTPHTANDQSKHRSRVPESPDISDGIDSPAHQAKADSPLKDHQEWTTQQWLESMDLAAPVAAILNAEVPKGKTPLEFFRDGGISRKQQLVHVLDGARLGGLTEYVWKALLDLQSKPTVTEMHDKFVQEGVGVLEYSDLSTFFGGLEKKVGPPNADVMAEMADEHTKKVDSNVEFTTGNYGLKTTSAKEWRFVREPFSTEGDNHWPTEDPRLLMEKHASPRKPMAIKELELRLDLASRMLRKTGEKQLILEEGVAARLYTGPLFVKYNGVLRGLDTSVPFLKDQMMQYCAGKDKNGKDKLNKYTTTLHAINSAIVKLSKLTRATSVYRGVGMRLPPTFFRPNHFGVMGGIDGAFMSTTVDRDVAMKYAASGTHGGCVLEIEQGMIDRGADISWLSQYPHEREVLFAPLTGLEVKSTRVEGGAIVVCMSISINLASLTIEQVIGKRKKMLIDMKESMLMGIENDEDLVAVDPLAQPHIRKVLDEKLEAGCLSEDDKWFNQDANLSKAVSQMVEERQQIIQEEEESGWVLGVKVERLIELHERAHKPADGKRWYKWQPAGEPCKDGSLNMKLENDANRQHSKFM